MVVLNLMPWREHKRTYESKLEKIILLMSALLAIALVVVVHSVLFSQVAAARGRVEKLQSERHQYKEIKQVNTIEAHTDNLKNMLQMLGEKENENVCFTSIVRHKNKFSFLGNAKSGLALTTFLKQWNVASLFSEIKVERLEERQDNHLLYFSLGAIEI
jgi:hypothetical protein